MTFAYFAFLLRTILHYALWVALSCVQNAPCILVAAKLLLFNNEIAYRYNDPENTLSITNAGWKSATTRKRLNAIPNVNILQSKGIWYLNGKEWDGKLIDIK